MKTGKIMTALVVGCAVLAGAMLAIEPGRAAVPSAAPGADMGFDSNKPIAVNADNFVADLKAEMGTYTGNVIVIQGAMKLHADQVVVHAPQGKASNMQAQGHVVIDSASGTATGETGTYDVGSRVVRLNGNVVLTREQYVMRGQALEVQVATGEARLVGGAPAKTSSGEPAKPGRVQGLFVPATKPAEPAKP